MGEDLKRKEKLLTYSKGKKRRTAIFPSDGEECLSPHAKKRVLKEQKKE